MLTSRPPAHDAKHGVEALAVALQRCRRRRDDGVVRPLVRRQAVGVVRVQYEVGAPILRQITDKSDKVVMQNALRPGQ